MQQKRTRMGKRSLQLATFARGLGMDIPPPFWEYWHVGFLTLSTVPD
jgi:hypothetical protein